MEQSSIPTRLLSSAPPISPQHSGHSGHSSNTIDSRGSYFSIVSSRAPLSPTPHLSEELANSGLLSPPLASPSCASELWSDYSGYSSDNNLLTPPLIQGDCEMPPYKSRSPSSASLNMHRQSTLPATPGILPRRERKRRLRNKQKGGHRDHSQLGSLKQYDSRSLQRQSDCLVAGAMRRRSSERLEHTETISGRMGRLRSTANVKGYRKVDRRSRFNSIPARETTDTQWKPVEILTSTGSGGLPGTGPDKFEQMTQDHHRSRTWGPPLIAADVFEAVRAKLTDHEVSVDQLPTPASITLRRASGMAADKNPKNLSSAVSAGFQKHIISGDIEHHEQRRSSAYLITDQDIDSITNMIQSRFELQPPNSRLILDGDNIRRPSMTDRGVLPQPGVPVPPMAVEGNVQQTPAGPRVTFSTHNMPGSTKAEGGVRKSSKQLHRGIVPEVIWEEGGSPTSQTSSSQANSFDEENSMKIDRTSAG